MSQLISREKRILRALYRQLLGDAALGKAFSMDKERLKSSARSLPAMFQRHGVVQVLLYWEHKEKEPYMVGILKPLLKELARENSALQKWGAGNQSCVVFFQQFAEETPANRLHDQVLCMELATWLTRTVDALTLAPDWKPDAMVEKP